MQIQRDDTTLPPSIDLTETGPCRPAQIGEAPPGNCTICQCTLDITAIPFPGNCLIPHYHHPGCLIRQAAAHAEDLPAYRGLKCPTCRVRCETDQVHRLVRTGTIEPTRTRHLPPPAERHATMSQIPEARLSTSEYQGHDVDEPEALAQALLRSMEIPDGGNSSRRFPMPTVLAASSRAPISEGGRNREERTESRPMMRGSSERRTHRDNVRERNDRRRRSRGRITQPSARQALEDRTTSDQASRGRDSGGQRRGRGQEVCRHWVRGRCTRGATCWHSHEQPQNQQQRGERDRERSPAERERWRRASSENRATDRMRRHAENVRGQEDHRGPRRRPNGATARTSARQEHRQHNRRGPNEEREEPRLPREVRRHGRGGTEGRQSSPRNEEPVRPDVEETVSPHYSPCSSEDGSNSAQNPAPLPRQGPGTLQRPALPIPVGRDSQRPRGGIVDTNPEEGEQDQRYDEGGERVEQDQALADDTLSQPSSQSSDVQRRISQFFSPVRHMNRDDTSRGSDLNGGGSDSDSGAEDGSDRDRCDGNGNSSGSGSDRNSM
jgi:hypothetical protein